MPVRLALYSQAIEQKGGAETPFRMYSPILEVQEASYNDQVPVDPLSRIPILFHFTDRRNLALIRERGGLFPLAQLEADGVEIPAPGSDEGSRNTDRQRNLHHYVHLCFRSNHPMEYVARQEGRISDTIFLQIHPSVLQWEGVLFCPGMANTNNIEFYAMEQARTMIDFEVLSPAPIGVTQRFNSDCRRRRSVKFWFRGRSLSN
jgi:hypothetical protein